MGQLHEIHIRNIDTLSFSDSCSSSIILFMPEDSRKSLEFQFQRYSPPYPAAQNSKIQLPAVLLIISYLTLGYDNFLSLISPLDIFPGYV